MSEVLSFRLNKTNPREARALEILSMWVKQGYSARFIMTKALLEMDHPGSDLEIRDDVRDWDLVVDQISQLIKILKEKQLAPPTRRHLVMEQPALSDNFLASIKQGIKPGIKYD